MFYACVIGMSVVYFAGAKGWEMLETWLIGRGF